MRPHGLILAALLAGCSTPDLPPLPADPGRKEEPGPSAPGSIEVAATDPGALTPVLEGDAVLPGVVILEPAFDPAAGVATFAVRNDTGRDLPDLILSVIFAVTPPAGPDGSRGPVVPRFESIEAPLRAGETRRMRVALASLLAGESAASFRVAAGLAEILTAGGDGLPGTTFLGGRLECVSLEADLTGARRTVTVGLAERGGAAAGTPIPPLEAQLLFGRAGDLLWIGPWILVPRSGPEGAREHRVQWNLDAAPGLAACDVYLRVREKR